MLIYGYLTTGVRREKTRISKWCALTRLLNEGPVLESVIALGIMGLIVFVSLWPLGSLLRAFLLGRDWKCSFSLWQWTLCAGCALFTLQQLFIGSSGTLPVKSLINPFSSHCSFTIAWVLLRAHTCKCFLLYTVTSIMCWHGVDVSERQCWR